MKKEQNTEQQRLIFDIIRYSQHKYSVSDLSIWLNLILLPIVAFCFGKLYFVTNFYLFAVVSAFFLVYFWVFLAVCCFDLLFSLTKKFAEKETDRILEKIRKEV